eukprot:COSAG02_NODE_27759_length_603_cov_0.873016_1_plen_123_part_10
MKTRLVAAAADWRTDLLLDAARAVKVTTDDAVYADVVVGLEHRLENFAQDWRIYHRRPLVLTLEMGGGLAERVSVGSAVPQAVWVAAYHLADDDFAASPKFLESLCVKNVTHYDKPVPSQQIL